MNSFICPPSSSGNSAVVWAVVGQTDVNQMTRANLHAFQLQPGALDVAHLLTKWPSSSEAQPTIRILTYADGKNEVCFHLNGKVIATLLQESVMKKNMLRRSPTVASSYHRNTTAVELYLPECDIAAVATTNNKRKRHSIISRSSNTTTTRTSSAEAASTPVPVKTKRIRRLLTVPVTGMLTATTDNFWGGNAPTFSSSQLREEHSNNKKKKKKSQTLRRGRAGECPKDPLSQFPQLCSPELLLRAKHAAHLARYIQQSVFLPNLSPTHAAIHDRKNISVAFSQKAALDLMCRIKSVLDANAALFEKITGAHDRDGSGGSRANTTKPCGHPSTSSIFELLRDHRSENLQLLLQAYNLLADACTPPKECQRD